MNPFIESGGSHYYTQTGLPRYGATLREARKHNLFPSITEILGDAWPKGYLTEWIIGEHVKARHNNPPTGDARAPVVPGEDPNEARDVYFSEIAKLANAVRDAAGARGNVIHDGAEAMLLGKKWDKADPSLARLWVWVEEEVEDVYWTEQSRGNLEMRIAGRADALIKTKGRERPLLIDYKGRKFDHGPRKGWTAKRYKRDLIQLAFYASTLPDPPRIANVYIHREGECPVEVAEYSDKEREKGLEMCRHVAAIWFYRKNYWPAIDHDGIIAHLEAMEANA